MVDAGIYFGQSGLIFGVPLAVLGIEPSAEVLRASAEIGATLLIASAVVGVDIVKTTYARPLDDREERLGLFTGVTVAGLMGIALSLLLSECVGHRWNWLYALFVGWDIASLLMMGVVVALQPSITYEWLNEDRRASRDDEPG